MCDNSSTKSRSDQGSDQKVQSDRGAVVRKACDFYQNMRKSCGPTGVGPKYAVQPGVGIQTRPVVRLRGGGKTDFFILYKTLYLHSPSPPSMTNFLVLYFLFEACTIDLSAGRGYPQPSPHRGGGKSAISPPPGIIHLGGTAVLTKTLVETKSDLGGGLVKMQG